MDALLVPVVIAVVGLAVYLFAKYPQLAEVGRIMFAVGLLVVLLRAPAEHVALHLR